MAPLQQNCKSCGNVFSGKFCNQCGEQVFTAHDKSIGHILEEGFHFITHFEGKFLGTLKTVLLQPGKLTADYTSGIRKKYFKPISFFLMLVVLYLIFPIFRGLNMRLEDHLATGLYGKYGLEQINEIMLAHSWSMEQVSEKFQAISSKVSKFLLLIIIPVMAVFNRLVLFRRKKVLFDHFIFATEMAAFFLLWGFLLLPVIMKLTGGLISKIGLGFLFRNEALIGVMVFIPFLVYVYKAAKRFYLLRTIGALFFSFGFVAVFALFMLTVYKFLLFVISVQFLR